jgi:hypothetical protein
MQWACDSVYAGCGGHAATFFSDLVASSRFVSLHFICCWQSKVKVLGCLELGGKLKLWAPYSGLNAALELYLCNFAGACLPAGMGSTGWCRTCMSNTAFSRVCAYLQTWVMSYVHEKYCLSVVCAFLRRRCCAYLAILSMLCSEVSCIDVDMHT